MELKRYIFCKLDVIKELELCTLYSMGFSTWMLSKLYKMSQWTPCNTTHKYNKIGILEKIRNNEESTRARYYLDGSAIIIPDFPSSDLVPRLIERCLDKYLKHLICVMLLTDGYASQNVIKMNNDSAVMHNIFFDLMFHTFDITPTSFRKTKRKNQTTYARKEIIPIFNRLRLYTPGFKKSPIDQSVEEYLSEPQPSLEFLLKAPKEIQIEAFRLGMCAEGSITPSLYKGYVRGILSFACAHPKLAEQWLEITKNIDLSGFSITKDKGSWSGINGIKTASKKDLEHFLNLGGFLKGAKVGRGSPYYYGFDKQEVLLALLKFMEISKKLSGVQELHSKIKNLAGKVIH